MTSMIGLEDKPFLLIHISFSGKHLYFAGGVRYFNFINNYNQCDPGRAFFQTTHVVATWCKVRRTVQVPSSKQVPYKVGSGPLPVTSMGP